MTIVAPYSNVRVEKAGGMVSVKDKSGSVTVQDVDGVTIDAPYSTIDVKNVRGAGGKVVSLASQSGRITVDHATGPMSINAPYTAVELRSITGNVELDSKSGSVEADDVRGNWKSRTEYSTIRLIGLHSETVLIENKSGSVDVDLAATTRSLEIFNSYSDVRVSVPKGLDAQVRLKAEYGSISSFFPIGSETMGSGALSIGSVGSGAGVFTIENKSGNIRVTEKRASQ